MAISEEGHSKPLFVPSRGNVNGNVYRSECIMRRLVPFLQQYHEDGDYVFWPDLASSHYAKDTVALLRDQNINFVRKQDNPPNLPQLRPIEKFWGILKSKVYNGVSRSTAKYQKKSKIPSTQLIFEHIFSQKKNTEIIPTCLRSLAFFIGLFT